jgi:spermidine/putrescine-binding protein
MAKAQGLNLDLNNKKRYVEFLTSKVTNYDHNNPDQKKDEPNSYMLKASIPKDFMDHLKNQNTSKFKWKNNKLSAMMSK